MPLSDHEQRILEEIERRLAEDDPRLDEQIARTDLYTHLARRVRRAALAFVAGFLVMVVTFFADLLLLAAVGFVVMVLSALLLYRYVGQLGRDQLRAMQEAGGGTLGGLLARIAARLRRPPAD
jgi:Flp pilus assembly protein TadB